MGERLRSFRVGSFATALLAAAAMACGPGGDSAPGPKPPAAPAPAQAPATVQPPSPEPAGASAATRKADLIFSTRCATCHGPGGAGDGPGSVALDPKPRDFRDATWQASVSDDHLRTIILEGGGAVGKSPLMPPNPDLVGQPEVVTALVEHVRGLGSRGHRGCVGLSGCAPADTAVAWASQTGRRCFCTLPDAVRGSDASATNSRGSLNAASRSRPHSRSASGSSRCPGAGTT